MSRGPESEVASRVLRRGKVVEEKLQIKMKNAAMTFVWVLIGILCIAEMFRECSGSSNKVVQNTVIRHDTIKLQGSSLTIYKDRIRPEYVTTAVHDTVVQELVREREIITAKLDSSGAHEYLGLDTIAMIALKVGGVMNSIPLRSVTRADCIHASITQVLTARDTTLRIDQITQTVTSSPTYALGIGFCYGSGLSGQLTPSFGVQLTRVLISW